MHRIFILGPQGCGKGTQAKLLAEALGLPYLSMGQLFREEVAGGGMLGEQIKNVINTGELVPDAVAKAVLAKRLSAPDALNGYILDGFPRNMAQFQVFEDFPQPTCVIVISLSKESSLDRLMKRAVLENRVDDTPEVIQRRLMIYENDTLPVINEYRKRGLVKDVDGEASISEVAENIRRLFIA